MRCFIAVDMSTPAVIDCLESLKSLGAPLRPVAPESLHLTLKFLGEIDEDQVARVNDAMTRALISFKPFQADLKGVGVFPNLKYMRVLWVGVESREIEEMQRNLDNQLIKLGFKRERRFHSHLTLARIKKRSGLGRVREFLQKYESTYFGSVTVDTVELKKSTLTPKGPIYSTLHAHRLNPSP